MRQANPETARCKSSLSANPGAADGNDLRSAGSALRRNLQAHRLGWRVKPLYAAEKVVAQQQPAQQNEVQQQNNADQGKKKCKHKSQRPCLDPSVCRAVFVSHFGLLLSSSLPRRLPGEPALSLSRRATCPPLLCNLIDSAGVPRLILNADDFGLTPGVNRSILELAQAGALTSATLMATGEAFSQAVIESSAVPRLGVGCHVVFVDGQSASAPGTIPTLASPAGQLRPTLGAFVRDLYLGRIDSGHIESEAVAQIQRLQQAGVQVTHVDTHKHTHLFPAVLRPLLRAALRCGIRAIRNPFEPSWAIAVTPGASTVRRVQIGILNRNRETFTRLVRQAGLATTDGAIGVLATGVLDAAILHALLTAMPPGTWELVCHPGYEDAALTAVRTRLRASRAIEHAALLAAVPGFPGVEPIHFSHLTGARP